MYKGLFLGLTTVDIINYVSFYPSSNEKLQAEKQLTFAGGPATNASIAFASFDNSTTLITCLGNNPVTEIAKEDIQTYKVKIICDHKNDSIIPIISSINIDLSNGDRSVVYTDTACNTLDSSCISSNVLEGIDIVMLDGYYLDAAIALAQQAKQKAIPVVLDGGSWKEGIDKLLPYVDYAVCSNNFQVPQGDLFTYLNDKGIQHIAKTEGSNPIHAQSGSSIQEIEVPSIKVVDTLGAGDIFHGSFCHYLLQRGDFFKALQSASETATRSCLYYGTREWIDPKNKS